MCTCQQDPAGIVVQTDDLSYLGVSPSIPRKVLASIFLQMSDSAVFNMSLLTCDVYSIIFSWQARVLRLFDPKVFRSFGMFWRGPPTPQWNMNEHEKWMRNE